jgi:hypothetical protein
MFVGSDQSRGRRDYLATWSGGCPPQRCNPGPPAATLTETAHARVL